MRRLQPNTVTDEKGRQRFHGAFTGGFSAGYFNTVGSEEGFKPAQFVSSRSNRAEKVSKSVTDFMDAEDGLLSGKLTTKNDLDSFASTSRPLDDDVDPIMAKLMKQFVLEPSNTIGKKLLGKLGWKPGMAIGPRKKKTDYFDDPEVAKMIMGSGKLPVSSVENGNITFSARYEGDLVPTKISAWIGTRGVGYDPELDSHHHSLRGLSHEEDTNERKLAGNRYHVSDLFKQSEKSQKVPDADDIQDTMYLDDDDDIAFGHSQSAASRKTYYSKEIPMDGYDKDLDDDDGFLSSTGEKSLVKPAILAKPSLQRCPTDDRPVLPGFVLAQYTPSTVTDFPPPIIPRDFKPRPHLIFAQAQILQEQQKTQQSPAATIIAARDPMQKFDQRKAAFQESSPAQKHDAEVTAATTGGASVFDLLRPADKERILKLAQQTHAAVTQQQQLQQHPLSDHIAGSTAEEISANDSVANTNSSSQMQERSERPMLVSQTLLQHTAFANLAASFKNRFASASDATLQSQTQAQQASQTQAGIRTAEAYKATQKQLETKGQSQNSVHTSSITTGIAGSSQNSATYPVCKPRRTEVAWSCSSLLCKRMNIKPVDNNNTNNLTTAAVKINQEGVLVCAVASKTKSIHEEQQQQAAAQEKIAESEVQLEAFLAADVYLQPVTAKPALSVFRSIFAEDSDEEEDDDDSEEEKDDVEQKDKEVLDEDTKASQPFAAGIDKNSAQQSKILGPQKDHTYDLLRKMDVVDTADEKGEETSTSGTVPEQRPLAMFVPRSQRLANAKSNISQSSTSLANSVDSGISAHISSSAAGGGMIHHILPSRPKPTVFSATAAANNPVKARKTMIATSFEDDEDSDDQEHSSIMRKQKPTGKKRPLFAISRSTHDTVDATTKKATVEAGDDQQDIHRSKINKEF